MGAGTLTGRVIAVSNRVARPKPGGGAAGGLAVGILAALREKGGVWFGWSGTTVHGEPGPAKRRAQENVEYITIDLQQHEFEGYYNGFSNNTLWPLFHYLLGYFSFRRRDYEAYCRVNALFARRLLSFLEPDDIIWVHDYHLLPLASELRRAGVKQPIGFFLHVPFPDFDLLRALPPYDHMLRSLAAYDVVGFQTERDLLSFQQSLTQPEIGGELLGDKRIRAFGREFVADVYPIGIDVDECEDSAKTNLDQPDVRRLMTSIGERRLMIGVDRLDYSKGLDLRFRAYERMLERYPSACGQTLLMQVAPPTRTGVRAYQDIRETLELAAGNINGRFAEIDWVPIRYLNRGYDRGILMSVLRLARVCLVTPIRDGMNLVAKEFVAAQNPADPGVLVLSNLAGASKELTGALLVNPYDRDAMADAFNQALEMALPERQERHGAMLEILRTNDIHAWRNRFIDDLRSAPVDLG